MASCPFCQTDIPQGATVCTGCNAQYGYGYGKQNERIGTESDVRKYRRAFLLLLLVPPALAALAALQFGPDVFAILLVWIFLVPLSIGAVIHASASLRKGPMWWRKS